ncbi:ABC transporter substrate-binding protein [Demequina aurantiaca]|uniref:ABC transporter substrate-binding protein n=1 Tax=Demequina aurantiaca TaxID=676200 RepID=UPI0007808EA4|nr:extracellular solute-binding protein [Demequina aurantiaca]
MKNSRQTGGIVAASAVMILALTACSSSASDGDAGNDSDAPAEANVELQFSHVDADDAGIAAVVAGFEAANPGITVTPTSLGVDAYNTTLTTQLSSGTGPDLLAVFPGSGSAMSAGKLGGAGYLVDLSDQDFASQIPEGLQAVTQADGKTVVAPVTLTAIGPIFNENALGETGLTAPDTWSGVIQLCKDAKAAGKTAFAIGAADAWTTQLIPHTLNATLTYGPNPDFAAQQAAGEVTFSDSGWVETFTEYQEMVDEGCFQDKPVGTTFDEAAKLVANGDALAIVSVNAHVAALEQMAPEGTTFKMEALPATDDPADTYMPGASGSTYAVNASSDHTAEGIKFINYLVSPEGITAYADALSALPVFPSNSPTPAALATFDGFLEAGKVTSFPEQQWPDASVQQAHFDSATGLLNGSLTPEEATAQMDSAYETALAANQ